MYKKLYLCLLMISFAMTQNVTSELNFISSTTNHTTEPDVIGSVLTNVYNGTSGSNETGSVANDSIGATLLLVTSAGAANNTEQDLGSALTINVKNTSDHTTGSILTNFQHTSEPSTTKPVAARRISTVTSGNMLSCVNTTQTKNVTRITKYRLKKDRLREAKMNIGISMEAAVRCTRRYRPGACATPNGPVWTYECFAQNCTERLGCPVRTEANRFPSYKSCITLCGPLVAIYNLMLQEISFGNNFRADHMRRSGVKPEEAPEILHSKTSQDVQYQDRGLIMMPEEEYDANDEDNLLPTDIDGSFEGRIINNNMSAV